MACSASLLTSLMWALHSVISCHSMCIKEESCYAAEAISLLQHQLDLEQEHVESADTNQVGAKIGSDEERVLLRRGTGGDQQNPEPFLSSTPDSPCREEDYIPCRDNWRPAPKCVAFEHFGINYSGCAPSSTVSGRWCSEDVVHGSSSHWHDCTPCIEEVALGAAHAHEAWETVSKKLHCRRLGPIAVTVGFASERVYSFSNGAEEDGGATKLRSVFPFASAGKWPAALGIFAAAKDSHGKITMETRASDTFEWWQKDGSPKADVKLVDLLHFTSGFTAPVGSVHSDPSIRCLTGFVDSDFSRHQAMGDNVTGSPSWASTHDNNGSLEECAKEIYEKSSYQGRPGGDWSYNSMHLQIAIAMVSKRTGLTACQILERYVFKPANMTNAYEDPISNKLNPVVSAALHGTGDDFDSFLRKYLAKELLQEEAWVEEFEKPVEVGPSWGFAMGHMLVGDSQQWGGTVYAVVNRPKGYYALMMLSMADYNNRGPIRNSIWGWIREDVEHALKLSV